MPTAIWSYNCGGNRATAALRAVQSWWRFSDLKLPNWRKVFLEADVIDTNPPSYVVKEGQSRSRDHQDEQCPEGRALAVGCFNLQVLCSGAGAVWVCPVGLYCGC